MPSKEPAVERRLVVGLASLSIALLGACGFLGWTLARHTGGGTFFGEDALRDPALRAEVVRQLAESNKQPFDSHPDPEVGRVLVADGQRDGFSTNAYGLRERPFALEKPAGTVRIVLLGDSFVFGLNVADADRLGAVLEHELGARAGASSVRYECLHVAVNSWNIASECAFLRRQLDRLRPDLVIQVTYSNDLDDVTGVRGFGAESSFSPRFMERADALIMDRHAQSFLQQDTRNFLSRGEDWESRTRFADALASIQRLRALLRELPGQPRYLLVVHWGALAPAFHAELGSKLEPDSIAYLPLELATDKSVWITPGDPHWNAKGHAEVAEFLYGAIRARGLLSEHAPGPWPEAEALAADWSARGLEFARANRQRLRDSLKDPVAAIAFPAPTLPEARQVHGGLDREGLVSPYASFVLRRTAGTKELHLVGRALPDRALAGLRVSVFLEELELGALELQPDAVLERRFPIPAALDGRDYLDVRLRAGDYVYRGDDLRHCVVFRLERAALE